MADILIDSCDKTGINGGHSIDSCDKTGINGGHSYR